MGQKQLISFARALAFDPAILILDEATSSIDTETEQLIQRAIERVMRDRTSIVVAHRLSTIQNADRIIVLHHGEIREQGTHQQLLAERGLYWKLYKLQYADTSREEVNTDKHGSIRITKILTKSVFIRGYFTLPLASASAPDPQMICKSEGTSASRAG